MTEGRDLAASPFDHPQADIILRSSDNVDFRVFKSIISLASPVFNDMVAFPQPAGEGDTLPVVCLTENAESLGLALRYCYPGSAPTLRDVADIKSVLAAAHKYQMDFIVPLVSEAYQRHSAFKTYPLQAFTVARKYNVESLAKAAAKETLRFSVRDLLAPEAELDGSTTAEDLRQLLVYHEKAREFLGMNHYNIKWGRATTAPMLQSFTSLREFSTIFEAHLDKLLEQNDIALDITF